MELCGNDPFQDLRLLESLYPDHYFGTWTPDDYKVFAEDLTDEECKKVTESIKRNHDAEIGVNWLVIEYHVEEVVSERNMVN